MLARGGGRKEPKAVIIGDSSCMGYRSCRQVGYYATPQHTITINDGSCVNASACNRVGYFIRNGNISIGYDACLGELSCYRVGFGDRQLNRFPGSVIVGDGACTESLICYRFGEIIDSGLVSIAPNTCTDNATDVCGTSIGVGGNETCNGGGCASGDSFILSNNTVTDCTQFCTA